MKSLNSLTVSPQILTCFWKVLERSSKGFEGFFIGLFKAYLYIAKWKIDLFQKVLRSLKVFEMIFLRFWSFIALLLMGSKQVLKTFWRPLKTFEKVFKTWIGPISKWTIKRKKDFTNFSAQVIEGLLKWFFNGFEENHKQEY